MNVLKHLATVLAELLREDDRRVVLGEDVADGTMLGLTKVAAEDEALASRLLSTPLCPTVLPAHAAGLAAEGLRPIVVCPEASALVDSLAAVREAAKVGWRHGTPAPVVFLAPFGPGFGLGGGATEGPGSILARIPGVRVVVLGDANEAGAVLRAAVEGWAGDEPTILLIPRTLALSAVSNTADTLARPFAAPRRVREGDAATVFTWGACLPLVQAAVERSGHDARIVDVECLAPLDRSALAEEAKATGKIVIVHGGPRHCGVGSELAALFADDAILTLDAPVLRVTGDDGPLTASAEARALPDLETLTTAITHVATY